jgi:urate oxidase
MPTDDHFPNAGFTLGPNNYGKSGVRVVRVGRESPRHELRDLTVHTALAGDFDATHYRGDNTGVLPTDTQKNTVYAFAREGIGAVESFAERLARHFVDGTPSVTTARVQVEEQAWSRIGEHSFTRGEGGELRTTEVVYDGRAVRTVSGVRDLLLLNTTDSEFSGFLVDEYTTLPETDDRILATAVTATWEYRSAAGATSDPTGSGAGASLGQEARTGIGPDESSAVRPGTGTDGFIEVDRPATGADGPVDAGPSVNGAAAAEAAQGDEAYDGTFFNSAFATARGALLEAFADTYSLSLQQTLYAVGERILKAIPEVAEVRLSLPNRHHYLFDLGRFGLDNPGVVFQAGDRPYGLIEGTVRRENA